MAVKNQWRGSDMNEKIISVTLELDAQRWGPQFSVPKRVCELLDVGSGDQVKLTILDQLGNKLLDGTKFLKSGTEIYGLDVAASIAPGQRIRIEVSKAD
jgi:hypothetical protein